MKTSIGLDLPLVSKAYLVGHKDEINNDYSPETNNTTIGVAVKESANVARIKFIRKNQWDDYKFIDIRARRQKMYDKYLFEGKELNLNDIYEKIAYRKWRADMENMVSENKGKKVYIWSGQWNAYWGYNGCGYTTLINDVGVYDIEDAWNRTSHCGLEKKISFQILKNQ